MTRMDQQPKQAGPVLAAARAHGLELEVREFPEGTPTAADAARAVGCTVDQIVKSLVFMADGRPLLVLASGGNRVDLAKVGKQVGAGRVRKADANQAREATGFSIGGTPPFGHPAPLEVLIDRDLTRFAEVWAAAGTPRHVFAIAPSDLVRASGGSVCDIAEVLASTG
jgi:prolyl-tRNA editing enzyme YbaK/EbsC (Cys-tRNA(Pro) deacylase)